MTESGVGGSGREHRLPLFPSLKSDIGSDHKLGPLAGHGEDGYTPGGAFCQGYPFCAKRYPRSKSALM